MKFEIIKSIHNSSLIHGSKIFSDIDILCYGCVNILASDVALLITNLVSSNYAYSTGMAEYSSKVFWSNGILVERIIGRPEYSSKENWSTNNPFGQNFRPKLRRPKILGRIFRNPLYRAVGAGTAGAAMAAPIILVTTNIREPHLSQRQL